MTMENMTVSNSSLFAPLVPVSWLAASIVLGACCVLGIPGNLAVMVILAQHLKEDSITPKLMLSLAVSDLLSLALLPMWIYNLLNGWMFGQGLCKLLSYIVYWNLYSSVFCVTLMSVQRYLQVLYPQQWAKLGRNGQIGLIFGIWTLSGILASYSFICQWVDKKKNQRLYCNQAFRNSQEKIAILFFESVILFVPLLIISCFYCRLHQRICQSTAFRTQRLTKLVVRIVVTFLIFSTPCIINNLVQIAVPGDLEGINSITRALFFINSCVNPFLYAFSARTLRFKSQMHSDQPHQNETACNSST